MNSQEGSLHREGELMINMMTNMLTNITISIFKIRLIMVIKLMTKMMITGRVS